MFISVKVGKKKKVSDRTKNSLRDVTKEDKIYSHWLSFTSQGKIFEFVFEDVQVQFVMLHVLFFSSSNSPTRSRI